MPKYASAEIPDGDTEWPSCETQAQGRAVARSFMIRVAGDKMPEGMQLPQAVFDAARLGFGDPPEGVNRLHRVKKQVAGRQVSVVDWERA